MGALSRDTPELAQMRQDMLAADYRMRDLAQAGDTDPLLREAHALAGSAATIGLDELGAAASELEHDLKSRRVTATAGRLDRIDRLARSGLDRLAAYLDKRAA